MVKNALTDAQIAALLEGIEGVRITDLPTPVFGAFGAARHAQHQVQVLAPSRVAPLLRLTEAERVQVARAFEKVRNGYEPDRVLVDPQLSRAYLAECRRRGLDAPVAILNRALQNIRKGKSYGIDLRESKSGSGLDAEPYLSIAEIAYSRLNHIRHVTVDQIVTNPRIGAEYVAFCRDIEPAGTAMNFKWAVLSLRKRRALSPERLKKIEHVDIGQIESRLKVIASAEKLKRSNLPDEKGVFAFSEMNGSSRYLFIGAAENLALSIRPFERSSVFRSPPAGGAPLADPRHIKLLFAASESKRYLVGKTTPLMASLGLIMARQPVYNMLTAASLAETEAA